MKRKTEPVTDNEIAHHFAGTNFGSADPRKLLEQGVLKTWAGYSSGHTLTGIMRAMKLITTRGTVTIRGRAFAFAAFYQQRHSG